MLDRASVAFLLLALVMGLGIGSTTSDGPDPVSRDGGIVDEPDPSFSWIEFLPALTGTENSRAKVGIIVDDGVPI